MGTPSSLMRQQEPTSPLANLAPHPSGFICNYKHGFLTKSPHYAKIHGVFEEKKKRTRGHNTQKLDQ
jgi:hypothetical protein